MSETVSIDLTPTLADRVSLIRLVEQLLLTGGGGELSYLRKDDRVTVQCAMPTAFELVHLLQECIAEDRDRDHVVACGVVMNKLNAALDVCLSRPLPPSVRTATTG